MHLPKTDVHFSKSAKKGYYQRGPIMLAMAMTTNWDTAVDIGGHVGFISCDLAKFFRRVHTFEPIPDNIECLVKNVPENVFVHGIALGAEKGMTSFENPWIGNSGGWTRTEGDHIKVKTLDSYELENVGLIKIDTQGSEFEVLSGAAETIKRCRPVVQAECVDKDENLPAIQLLEDLGMTLMVTVNCDGIWAFR